MILDKKTSEDIFPWSPWVPLGAAVIASVAMSIALIQRDPVGPLIRPVIYASLAMLPFLLDGLDVLLPFRLALPLWLFPVPVLVGGGLLVSNPAEVDFAPFIFVFLTAEVASRASKNLAISIGTLAGAIGIMIGLGIAGRFDESFIWVIGISFGWFGGFLIQSLAGKTLELKEAQAGLSEKAATDERRRIAREVHDVIAHSMSVTMLHITAARMALERDRVSDAMEALREAEQQGRNSLRDIRRTVGLLGPDESASTPPMPAAGDVPRLIADFRTAGLEVDLSVTGDVGSLPPAMGLNLYRIVQESLTNVVNHAPGAKASVELSVGEEVVRLRVHNDTGNGSSSGRTDGGLGVKGMAGRAALLGGTLRAGAEGSGWTVSLLAPASGGVTRA